MSKLTKFFVLIVGLIFIFGAVSSAQETTGEEPSEEALEEVALDETVEAEDLEITEPTLLPDSPFYFFKNWGREIRAFFTFNKVNKANLRARYASEKLLELRKLTEKVKDPEIIKKATENYDREIGKIKAAADKIRETATENPKVGRFLDKFIKQQVLHQKILEKLEEQVPVEAFEKIAESREKHLERFGEVMHKLENKTKITERLEKNLRELKGSEFKGFKNLEILKRLEEKVPEEAKEAIRKARENTLRRLKEKLEQMSTTTQEKFTDYIERIRGTEENKMEILENLKSELRETPRLLEKLENIREGIIERLPEQIQLRRRECPMLAPLASGFCKEGRIFIEKDASGCPLTPKCVMPAEQEVKPLPTTVTPKPVCIALWDPVCGKDGKTYSNACFAKVAGVEIDHRGVCQREEEKPTTSLANPAAVYCQKMGYKLATRTKSDGGQYGVCIFPDGKECNQWSFFRSECGIDYKK